MTIHQRIIGLLTLALATTAIAGCGSDDPGADGGLADGIPENVSFVVSGTLDPDDDQAAAIDDFASNVLGIDDIGALITPQLDAALANAEPPVDFSEQVQPLLGHRAVIWSTQAGDTVDEVAFLIETDDPDGARDFIETTAADTETGEYDGTEYRVVPGDEEAYVGVTGDLVVIASPQAFEEAIDALADDAEGPSEVATQLESDALASLYVNVAAFIDQQPEAAQIRELVPELVAKPMTLDLTAAENSFSIDASLGSLGDFAGADTESSMLSELPADAIFAAGGADVGASYEAVFNLIPEVSPDAADFDEAAREFEQATGVALESAVGAIGDIGFFLRGGSVQTLDGGLLVESLDPETTADLLDSAIDAARREGNRLGTPPSSLDADAGFSVPAAEVGVPFDVIAAQRGDRVAFGSEAAVSELLSPGETIDSAPAYQEARAALEDLNLTGYADLQSLAALIESAAGGDPRAVVAASYLGRLAFAAYGAADDGETFRLRFTVGGSSGD